MPSSTQHALITWLPGSKIGLREAIRLNSIFPKFSVKKVMSSISVYDIDSYMCTLVIGLENEFNLSFDEWVNKLKQKTKWMWLVLVVIDPLNIGSGQTKSIIYTKYLAKKYSIKVSGTTRSLSTNEVGNGKAFALTLGEILIRSDYEGSGALWEDYEGEKKVVYGFSQYYGHEYYYLIFGHGGVPKGFGGKTFPLKKVNMIFYCLDGETSDQARKKNINADWPKLLRRFKEGNTLPSEHVAETYNENQPCQALFAFPDQNIPDMGVYFVSRKKPGELPYIIQKIAPISSPYQFLLTIINNIIIPDAENRILTFPVNIHWLACRYHMQQ